MKRLGSFVMLILFLVSIMLLIIIPKLWGDGAEVQQGRYVPQVLISAPWGEKNLTYDEEVSRPGEFGLYAPPEGYDLGPDKGPVDFTVAPNGYIYITDFLNERIQIFDSSGGFVSVIPGLWSFDGIFVDHEGNIYLGAFDWTFYPKVEKYDQDGNLLMTYHLGKWEQVREGKYGYRSVNHWAGSGYISCDNSGRLFLKYDKQDRPLFPGDTIPAGREFIFQFGTTTQEFSFEQQMSTLRIPATWSWNVNLPDWEQHLHKIKGKTFSMKSERNAQRSLAKGLPSGKEGFIGIGEDAVYNIARDEKNPDNSVILKYDYDGDLVGYYTLNWKEGDCETFGTEYQEVAWVKKRMVFDKGFLYTYIHCKDGLKIIKWSPVEGGN